EAADAVLHGLEEELFLVAEVVVDGALGDAGIARDAVDGRALVAEAREAIDRRRHELLPRRLGPLGPRLAAARHTERSVSSPTRRRSTATWATSRPRRWRSRSRRRPTSSGSARSARSSGGSPTSRPSTPRCGPASGPGWRRTRTRRSSPTGRWQTAGFSCRTRRAGCAPISSGSHAGAPGHKTLGARPLLAPLTLRSAAPIPP